ncbi:hypothetical protein [Clostridium saccharoperbutylacetonicum]|uniref:hypothetical protein n=1 Tax=Clostridium saccharoperbutylacetonicum TaxID=36745 RepID=UPI0039E9E090
MVHNYKKSNDPKAELLDYINQPIRINEKIFLRDLNVIIRRLKINCKIDFDEIWRKQFGKLEMEKKIEEGKKLAMMDSNKNYPDTVSENKKILFNYIKFLNDRNIKVYIVVFPVTKYYSRYFCAILKEEFYNIMEELNKKCEFTCIDYFDSNEFSDEEFSDSSHLNICGAKKFTKILNEII